MRHYTFSHIRHQFTNYLFSQPQRLNLKPENVLIEFSSPNIAKPFHPGHFRATVVGNFISNINEVFGHYVKRINYLGDWGSQFGYLLHGMQTFGDFDVKEKSLRDLCQIYVRANTTLTSDADKVAIDSIVSRLEGADEKLVCIWKHIQRHSIDRLKSIYERLEIQFNEFECESDYVVQAKEFVEQLRRTGSKSIALMNGAVIYQINDDEQVVLLTKHGSTLYLTRDIAAAISRQNRYRPDRVHYVVEDGQSHHFTVLSKILSKEGYNLNTGLDYSTIADVHVKFGRVLKMSTRKGTMMFLDDIIDHAKTLMLNKLISGKMRTSKEQLEQTAENLGRTLLVCEILQLPRQKPLEFSWNRDNFGFRLQYCRSSLNSLEEKCKHKLLEVDMTEDWFDFSRYDSLNSFQSVVEARKHILKFDDVLIRCYREYESNYLIDYISKFSGLVHKCLREVRVIGAPSEPEAKIRLKFFLLSKFVLDYASEILGLPKVDRI